MDSVLSTITPLWDDGGRVRRWFLDSLATVGDGGVVPYNYEMEPLVLRVWSRSAFSGR